MNIAFFHEFFPMGGAERVTIDLCEYLTSHGYHISLFTRTYEPDKLPVGSTFHRDTGVFILPDKRKADTRENAHFIAHTCARHNIKVLIVQAYMLSNIDEIKRANTNLKVIFCNHSMPLWEIGYTACQRRQKSSLSALRAIKYYLIDYPKIHWLKTYQRRFYRAYHKTFNAVDAFVSLCDSYSQEIKQRLNIKDDHKLYAINNSEKPVDNIVLDKEHVVLYVGRLTYADKRVDLLLDIWHMLDGHRGDWQLIIVGDGPERQRLEAQAQRLQLSGVTFAGFCPDTRPYYDRAAILCLTSAFEGWGLALTEAQAHGVVPIAFGCSQGVETILLPHKVNGMIITPFDTKSYAHNLLTLMNDHQLRATMQKNVIEKSKSYSPCVVGSQWASLIEDIAAR